jgi:hypothetical protein
VPLGAHHQTTARRAHARVHDGEVDGAGRERGARSLQQERARRHGLRRHLVREVHDPQLGTDGEEHALHLGHVAVGVAEIRW